MYSDKKAQYCNNCQNYSINAVSMLCGHKICHNCLKMTKSQSNSCLVCNSNFYSKIKKNQTSPDEQNIPSQNKKGKQKIVYRITSPSTHKGNSSSPGKTNRTSKKQIINKPYKKFSYQNQQKVSNENLSCRSHNEPLIMYEQKNKQLYCAQCLYLKNKKNTNTIPIKNALDLINNENRLNRQQSRGTLSIIQNSMKTCISNKCLFETTINHYGQRIQRQFEELVKQLKKKQLQLKFHIQNLFESRISQYKRIINDLDFLKSSIKQYRQYNKKQTQNINTAIYIFSAYKIIKKTVSTLDLNYVTYTLPDLSILDLDKKYFQDFLQNYGRIKDQLPIKSYQIKISRITSLQKSKKIPNNYTPNLKQDNSTSIIKNQPKQKSPQNNLSVTPRKQDQPKPRHKLQFSLSHNICDPPQKNLYERLLQQKFNKYSQK